MADTETKVPVQAQTRPAERATGVDVWRPFQSLRREVDQLFEDFDRDFWRPSLRRSFDFEPFWERVSAPAADITEREKDYQITVEMPGMSEKDVELKITNDMLTIKGEKNEEKEQKRKDYHVSERRYGAFERSFRLPDGIDRDKIEAAFGKGVLTITLPKKPEAIKAERKIEVKAG
jgi:HSP20 family protein